MGSVGGGDGKAGEKMKSKQGWKKNEDKSGNGNDNSGFNGLPGGYCDAYGSFHYVTEEGYFWSSSEDNADYAWSRYLYYKKVIRNNRNKNSGLSVRCIRD